MLRVTERTVQNWLARGQLVAVVFGENGLVRIKGESIFRFLKPYRPKKCGGTIKKVRRKVVVRKDNDPKKS